MVKSFLLSAYKFLPCSQLHANLTTNSVCSLLLRDNELHVYHIHEVMHMRDNPHKPVSLAQPLQRRYRLLQRRMIRLQKL